MRLSLAAAGAVIAALLQLTVLPYLRIGGAQPELVLVFAVTMAVFGDLESALIWAFVGGLMLDVLAERPLGLTAFTSLLVVAPAIVLGRMLERTRVLAPALATLPLTVGYSFVFLVAYGLLRGAVPLSDPIGATVPVAIYSSAIALVIGPVVMAIRVRTVERERVAW